MQKCYILKRVLQVMWCDPNLSWKRFFMHLLICHENQVCKWSNLLHVLFESNEHIHVMKITLMLFMWTLCGSWWLFLCHGSYDIIMIWILWKAYGMKIIRISNDEWMNAMLWMFYLGHMMRLGANAILLVDVPH